MRCTFDLNRQRCGDVELTGYLVNEVVPVSLVLDLRITHDGWGSSSDPSINGHLHYPNDIDRSLNETDTVKIRKYDADYNNNPPSSVAFMPIIVSTSGRLHSEFVWLLFLQAHRETDRFFAASGVQLVQSTDDAPVSSRSHTHPSHSQTARLLISSMSLGITVPREEPYIPQL